MNKIQFFYNDDLILLQAKINEWLDEHPEIKILKANLSSMGKPSQRAGIVSTEKYVFYVLYVTSQWESIVLEQKAEESLPALEQLETKTALNLPN